MKRLAIVARGLSPTNRALLDAAAAHGLDAFVVTPEQASRRLVPGDVALGRIDVLPTLDGPEPGLDAIQRLQEQGVQVLNHAGALLGAHDKLMTALKLAAARLPHPRTSHVDGETEPQFEFPVVVKPRFGSWGRDVTICESRAELDRRLRDLRRRRWFRRHGALVQELIPPAGHDLRILVAAGEVVGAVTRVAAAGEWRTNIALGGERRPAAPSPQARTLALRAAAALDADLVGVDLVPDPVRGWVILELNGAVDFSPEYGLAGERVFERVVQALARRSWRAPALVPAVAVDI
jgi:[lysine-biosynthesis-protein LysW]---L-2-aminoadipate ligase